MANLTGSQRFACSRARELVRAASRLTSEMARRKAAEGGSVLRLSGAPIELPPEHILEAARAATYDNVHPPSRGLPELRQAIAERVGQETGLGIDPDSEVIVTNGGMAALGLISTVVLDRDDEVMIPSPCFFFGGIIHLADGVPIYVPMDEAAGFRFDPDRIRAAITPRTKVFLLNTPVNPTGYVASLEDLEAIAQIAQEHDLLVVSDESYDHLVYDSRRHHSIASLPGMSSRTVTVRSFSKSYSMPQWRVGYAVGPAKLIELLVKVLEWRALSVNYVAQKAATAAISGPQQWTHQVCQTFEAHRNRLWEGIRDVPGLTCVKPMGGPFFFPNISTVSASSDSFARYLLASYGLPLDPGHYYQSDAHIRVPFGAKTETIDLLVERLSDGVTAYQNALGIREEHGDFPNA